MTTTVCESIHENKIKNIQNVSILSIGIISLGSCLFYALSKASGGGI